MRNVLRSPLFRCIVCLILVCCILVNVSPIRTQAVALGPAAAATGLGLGVVLYIYLLMSGFITNPPDIGIYEDLDISFRQYADEIADWDKLNQDLDDLNQHFEDNDPSNDSTDPTDPNLSKIPIGSYLRNLIAPWIVGAIVDGVIDIAKAVDPGYSYFNEFYFPDIPDSFADYPYYLILANDALDSFILYGSTTRVTVYYGDGYNSYPAVEGGSYSYCRYYPNSSDWGSFVTDCSVNKGYNLTSSAFSPIWSNFDLYDYKDQTVIRMAASEPSDTQLVGVPADVILGDLAQGIQAGTMTEDDIDLPSYLDLSEFKLYEETAYENLAQAAQQLSEGQMTVDDFRDIVSPNDAVDPNPGESVPSETTPSTDPTVPEGDGSDASKFTVDLSNFFPFCIPGDIVAMIAALTATPVAPKFHWELRDLSGNVYPVDIDLSPWDSFAKLFRDAQVVLFIIGLAFKTKDLIQW